MYKQRPRQMLHRDSGLPLELSDYEKTVYVTWAMSYNLLSKRAQKMLWLMAYLQWDQITQEIFRRATLNMRIFKLALNETKSYLGNFLDSDGAWDLDSFLTTITEITICSLVSFDRVNQTYGLHVLVQEWAQTMIPHPPEETLAQSMFLFFLPIDNEEVTQVSAFRQSLELHVNSLTKHRAYIVPNSAARFGCIPEEAGQYEKSAELRLHVLGEMKKFGNTYHQTLIATKHLALTYLRQGLPD
ncbi:hypothetical protein FRC07_009686 [Ceratobasidium sp. 392]|nr:hypothetical protein FRC07_009686 [Ceratobasidium sp. 392]